VNSARSHPTRSRHLRSRAWRFAALAAAGAAVLAACGDDDDDSASDTTGAVATSAAAPTTGAPATTAAAPTTGAPATTAGPATTAAPETTAAAPATTAAAPGTTGAPAGEPAVATAETDLGTILVDAEGFTLYAFLSDTAGEPTCTGGCAEAWPPALVEGEPSYGDLDPSVFSLVESPTGGQQLKAGDWPLYRYAGDQAPGDVTGQGSGGVWYVVAPDGTVIE
jgi:predicted lipoprotein with Yx(FWY)xxD motif